LLDLCSGYESSALNPDQLAAGPFHGVRERACSDGRLLAAGETHV